MFQQTSFDLQLFYSVSIPVTLWFITKNKAQKGKTLFIDARQMGHMVDRKHRDFSEEDIQKLTKTFEDFQADKLENVKGYCFVAGLEDIKNNDYILTPGRYVGIADDEDEDVVFEDKMGNLTSELGELFVKSDKLQGEIVDVLGKLGWKI